jgi:restriction endonuclease S subunit
MTSSFPHIEIGEVCKLVNGRTFKPEDWEVKEEGGLPIIRIQNLNNPDAEFNYYSKPVDEKYIVLNGDLLFSWSGSKGSSFGAFIWNGGKAILNQHIFNVKHSDKLNRKYLHYILNKAVGQVEENLNGGVGLVHITKSNLEKILIPIPPVSVQIKILNEIEEIQKVIDNTEQILKYYKPTFEIDATWEYKNLSEVCLVITDGTHYKPTYCSKGYKFLSAKNVTKKIIDWTDVKYIDEKQHQELSKRVKPQRNDILLAKNGTTGVAAINNTDEVFDIYVSLALLRPSELIDPYYLLYVINSELVKNQFNDRLKGVGVPNLHLKEIKEVNIPLPDVNTQKEIVSIMKAKWNYLEQTELVRNEYQRKLDTIINRIWSE